MIFHFDIFNINNTTFYESVNNETYLSISITKDKWSNFEAILFNGTQIKKVESHSKTELLDISSRITHLLVTEGVISKSTFITYYYGSTKIEQHVKKTSQ